MSDLGFHLQGYLSPTGQYPASVVPVGRWREGLAAVYTGEKGPEPITIDEATKWLGFPAWHSSDLGDFDYSSEGLFALTPACLVRIPFSEETQFYSLLLHNPFFCEEDPFIRLSLAEMAGDAILLRRELSRCVGYFQKTGPDMLDSWYRAAISSISGLSWDAGRWPDNWSELRIVAGERRLPLMVVMPRAASNSSRVAAVLTNHLGLAGMEVAWQYSPCDGQWRAASSRELLELVRLAWRAESLVLTGDERDSHGTLVYILEHGPKNPVLDELVSKIEHVDLVPDAASFEKTLFSIFKRVRIFRPADIESFLGKAGAIASNDEPAPSPEGTKRNSRTISPEIWERARTALVFYFSRRHGIGHAEDLAQETLLALWRRPDFEFEKDEDFLKVSYAFAKRIAHGRFRDARRHAGVELPPEFGSGDYRTQGLAPAELGVFLDEVLLAAQTHLTDQDRQLIKSSIDSDGFETGATDSGGSGKLRVRLHRARKKLAKLTGWRKQGK